MSIFRVIDTLSKVNLADQGLDVDLGKSREGDSNIHSLQGPYELLVRSPRKE